MLVVVKDLCTTVPHLWLSIENRPIWLIGQEKYISLPEMVEHVHSFSIYDACDS